jgi:DNA-binding response OmpR family regulator
MGEKLILERNPDLVILDVMMEEPDDGFYLAQKLRKHSFTKPIILLSSISKTIGFDFEKSDVIHVDVFLEKPISPQKLIQTVENFLSKGGRNDNN